MLERIKTNELLANIFKPLHYFYKNFFFKGLLIKKHFWFDALDCKS